MPPLSKTTIERLLDRVRRPSRYIGQETYEVRKDPRTVGLRLCLVFPEVYEIGMSHLGLRILYDLLNRDPELYAERAFCPWPDMEALMRTEGVPLWSLETRTPLGEFDIVGFSLQSELIGTNILTMLDLAGIPLLAADRTDEHPIIIGGGPVVFNPEPLADFFDCFLIGDGEEAFPALLHRLLALKQDGITRRETILEELSRCAGVYVPGLYSTHVDETTGFTLVQDSGRAPYPVRKALVRDLAAHPFPTDMLVPQGEIVHDRYAVEIARGCTEGCRFCQAGMIYRPVRERPPGHIVHAIVRGIERTGYDEASLTALSTADYSCIDPLARAVMDRLARRQTAMSVSSLRVYGLTERLAEDIARVRKTGFTIAPEAGTQRLRDVINKGITDEDIDAAARIAFSAGWRLLKLYFMIGLPTETDDDVAGIAKTAIRVLSLSQGPGGRPRANINVAVASFVPKPHTPFAWAPFADPEQLKRKQDLLLALIRRHRNINIKFHSVKLSALEAVMARGDRRLGKVIKTAWERGARFDEWDEHFRREIWDEALAVCRVDPWRCHAAIPLDARLPWRHIDTRVEPDFLKRECRRGLDGRVSPPCEKPLRLHTADHGQDGSGKTKLVCYSCGLECDLARIAEERARESDEAASLLLPAEEDSSEKAGAKATYRYRLTYGKQGWSRYLSHLEVVRLLQRAFRRAGIRLAYSEGFHPHPKMSFGPALPVGVEGDREYLDFLTRVQYECTELSLLLSRELPETFPVHEVRELAKDAPAIEQEIDQYWYEIFLPDGMAGEVAQRMKDKLAGGSWPIVRHADHGVRELDAGPYIVSVEETAVPGHPAIALILASREGRTVKPTELLSSLLGEISPGTRITRRRMGRRAANQNAPAIEVN